MVRSSAAFYGEKTVDLPMLPHLIEGPLVPTPPEEASVHSSLEDLSIPGPSQTCP